MHPLLKPKWIVGHLLALVAVIGFVNLGLWQLRRHDEKADLRDRVTAARTESPVPLGAVSEPFVRVSAAGVFLAENQTKVLRSQDGVSGYHVITILDLGEDEGVVVDRGWISLDAPIPAPPTDQLTVEGMLWPAEQGSSIPGSLEPAIRRIDPEILQAFTDLQLRAEYLVLEGVTASTADDPVFPEPPTIDMGPHLSYAVQWFVFAAIVLVGYPILLRRTTRA